MRFLKTLIALMILGVVLNTITRINIYTDEYNKWKDVIIVTSVDEIKGYSKIEGAKVTGKTRIPLGYSYTIVKWAKIALKKEANKMGATMVLVSKEDLKGEDFKNIKIVGIPYKLKE